MNVFSTKLVAFLGSILLALPPGWCCKAAGLERAQPAPVQKSRCCDGNAPDQPAQSTNIPCQSSNCACCRDGNAVVPEKQEHLDSVTPSFDVVFATDVDAGVRSMSFVDVPFSVIHFGPRLHILQCVWRC
jgi:hypothetical protein